MTAEYVELLRQVVIIVAVSALVVLAACLVWEMCQSAREARQRSRHDRLAAEWRALRQAQRINDVLLAARRAMRDDKRQPPRPSRW